MKILAIETSCDETAIAIIEATGDETRADFKVLGNALLSQIEIHKPFGGVFPALAKREHAKNLVPILEAALKEAELLHEERQELSDETRDKIAAILSREPGLSEQFFDFVSECEPPAIDVIAVTAGPGLEPALWVGINFAKALALLWEKPLVAVNHMEGHILAALVKESANTAPSGTRFNLVIEIEMPVLALLISGGHTELVLMKSWLEYELIGRTRDDAVGETFDKVARMLALPYPGGPEISRLAEQARAQRAEESATGLPDLGPGADSSAPRLPRPMIDSLTCDFSFAGLKTAVLYLLKSREKSRNENGAGMIYHTSDLSDTETQHLAWEFEDAVGDVLWKKTAQALKTTGAQTLVIGGGVSANTHIRRTFRERIAREFPEIGLRVPEPSLTTDNAVMIALAGFYRAERKEFVRPLDKLGASGNLSLAPR